MSKTFLMAVALVVGTAALAAEKYVDPNPFANYGPAMTSTKADPLAANWSIENDAKIAAATEESVLAAFVADDATAMALLKQVRGAYKTDPLVMVQIAAVTQWVMRPDPCFLFFWKPFPSEGRLIWTSALEECISKTDDRYVRTFLRQQLDLCK